MKRLSTCAWLLAALFQAGCFEAEAPLGPPGRERLDPKLAGVWQCQPPEEDERSTMTILPFDERQFFVEWREDGAKAEDVGRYRAHATRVGGRTLVNLGALDTTQAQDWFFVRYAFEADGRLRLFIVDQGAVGTKDSADGLAVVRKRAMDDALYVPFAVCGK